MRCITLLVLLSLAAAFDHGGETSKPSNISKRSSENFCCKNAPKRPIIKTRMEKRGRAEKWNYISGYERCGLFFTEVCSKYAMRYRMFWYYAIEKYAAPTDQSCAEQDKVCCEGFMFIKALNKCVAIDELDSVIDKLNG
ncbi:uncharacterized protein LOC141900601 [Tubulanus polymorphus]|uniref:uncharacterized protein LOC141900601 n=1 Tax=Tubulanus polymorphus TaxID=672921 RepID=UPI003DA5030C